MPEKKPKKKIIQGLNNYAKYSGLAFQMVAIIMIGVFGGIKLDAWLEMGFPVFTLILSLLGTGFAIYYGIKDFIHMK
jgi:F0F1-type ATP synthase assembly protein I